MPRCPRCDEAVEPRARFCSGCGTSLAGVRDGTAGADAGAPGAAGPPRRAAMRASLVAGLIAVAAGALAFGLGGRGCSRVEGALAAAGRPLGDFTFTPTVCRSGQRMGFAGAALVGDGPTDGGILVVDDPIQGRFLKVEIPGSCKPPDHEVCTEIDIRPEHCRVFDVAVKRTAVRVNEVRLVAGHARVECAFPEGGSARADLRFDRCD